METVAGVAKSNGLAKGENGQGKTWIVQKNAKEPSS